MGHRPVFFFQAGPIRPWVWPSPSSSLVVKVFQTYFFLTHRLCFLQIVDGVPRLVPKDGKVLEDDDRQKSDVADTK